MGEKWLRYCASKAGTTPQQAQKVLQLMIEEQCTVPFIARYRKEATGNLNELHIRALESAYQEYQECEKRREYILESLKKSEQLTNALEKSIRQAQNLSQLEEIYAPYKSKKKTKATLAKEKGLEPLANQIFSGSESIEALKAAFNPTESVKTFDEALEGAKAILVERMAQIPELRKSLRHQFDKFGNLTSSKRSNAEKVKDHLKFKDYFEYTEPLKALFSPKASHRFLALCRGRAQKVLSLSLTIDENEAIKQVERFSLKNREIEKLDCLATLKECTQIAYKRVLQPSLEAEFFSELSKTADEAAISVFGVNLKNLLLAPYLGAKPVLGVDPGVRTGCKLVVVDATGKLLLDYVIYLKGGDEKLNKAKEDLTNVINACQIEHIAIGDGTYGRETLQFIEENIDAVKEGKVKATLISESGASVYSASKVAIEEFPDKDVTVRGAVSIARRFQDPLSELVKIDPKSIGVGQYQHDVNKHRLKKNLQHVVEDCVNFVGVDLNTASPHILSYISGIGPAIAQNIFNYRSQHGKFRRRQDLMHVARFSEKVFQQAAGFLRIYEGENLLDSTFVHPECYKPISEWCNRNAINVNTLVNNSDAKEKFSKDDSLKKALGEHTFKDIVTSLKAPSQDPRTLFKSTEFTKGLNELSDINVGEWYVGVVNNITNFGAFINIGIKETGLVHVSQMSDKFVEDPLKVFKVGQEVKVRAIEVDLERKRLALSCKSENPPAVARPKPKKKPFKAKPKRPPQKKNKPRRQTDLTSNPFADALKGLKVNN